MFMLLEGTAEVIVYMDLYCNSYVQFAIPNLFLLHDSEVIMYAYYEQYVTVDQS